MNLTSTLFGLIIMGVVSAMLLATTRSVLLTKKNYIEKREILLAEKSALVTMTRLARRAYNPYLPTIAENGKVYIIPVWPEINTDACNVKRAYVLELGLSEVKLSTKAEVCGRARDKPVLVIPLEAVIRVSLEEGRLTFSSLINSDKQVGATGLENFSTSYDDEYLRIVAGNRELELYLPGDYQTTEFLY